MEGRNTAFHRVSVWDCLEISSAIFCDSTALDVRASRRNGRLEVTVTDTGVGIAAEDHQAVFEEFTQLGRDYTKKSEGTGLGLALTRKFVELHGGSIRLESEPGKGSTFTFTLPDRG